MAMSCLRRKVYYTMLHQNQRDSCAYWTDTRIFAHFMAGPQILKIYFCKIKNPSSHLNKQSRQWFQA